MILKFEPLCDMVCDLAESPVWDAGLNALLWCDIPAGRIFERRMDTGALRSWSFDGPVGSFGLARDQSLVVACLHDILLLDRATGGITQLAGVEAGNKRTRLNDGKVGPDGAFWVGTMDDTPAKEPIGALYRVTGDGKVEKKADGIITSNGLAWSADGRIMFHSDSRARRLDRYSFDVTTGAAIERRQIATMTDEKGRPDGGATDIAGTYWSAGVTAGQLNRFDAGGALLGAVAFPVPAPTMPCFGGPDMRTLFVTSLRAGLSAAARAAAPLSGSVFCARAEMAGVPVCRFAN